MFDRKAGAVNAPRSRRAVRPARWAMLLTSIHWPRRPEKGHTGCNRGELDDDPAKIRRSVAAVLGVGTRVRANGRRTARDISVEADAQDRDLGLLLRDRAAGPAHSLRRHRGDSNAAHVEPETAGRGRRFGGPDRAVAARYLRSGEGSRTGRTHPD